MMKISNNGGKAVIQINLEKTIRLMIGGFYETRFLEGTGHRGRSDDQGSGEGCPTGPLILFYKGGRPWQGV